MTDSLRAPRLAIVSVGYPVEISPTIKALCSYLAETRGVPVDVITDDLRRDTAFTSPDMRIHQLRPHWLAGRRRWRADTLPGRAGNRLLNMIRVFETRIGDIVMRSRLRHRLHRYDVFLCVEAKTLRLLTEAGGDPASVAYLSLEGADILREVFPGDSAASLLNRCRFCIIQSPERRAGIERELKTTLNVEYLPVCRRPAPELPPAMVRDDLRIIHSGYFAAWSCLREFLFAFGQSGVARTDPVYLQGHASGTEDYLAEVRHLAASLPHATVDTGFYPDQAHQSLLTGHDIGLAFYEDPRGTANWQNLVFSSGKIANYLWAGLAVFTNLEHPLTRRPPFLALDPRRPEAIAQAVERVRQDRLRYRDAARRVAEEHYNLDRHMRPIMDRIRT